jgi:hypothetical protein
MAGIGEFEVCFEPVDLWGFFFLLHNHFTINTTPQGWELLVRFVYSYIHCTYWYKSILFMVIEWTCSAQRPPELNFSPGDL